jgi:dissimilatory sulfite reductase (desulfoviridin) alpha/beta subunit
MPDIINNLIEIKYIRKSEDGHKRIKVKGISVEHISFYIAYPHGDGVIMVPYKNVKSIHTVSFEDIKKIQRDVQEMGVQAANMRK